MIEELLQKIGLEIISWSWWFALGLFLGAFVYGLICNKKITREDFYWGFGIVGVYASVCGIAKLL